MVLCRYARRRAQRMSANSALIANTLRTPITTYELIANSRLSAPRAELAESGTSKHEAGNHSGPFHTLLGDTYLGMIYST